MLGASVPTTILLLQTLGSGSGSENAVASAARASGVVFQIPQPPRPPALQTYRFGDTRVSLSLPFPVARDQSYPMFWYFLSFLGTQGNGRQIRDEGERPHAVSTLWACSQWPAWVYMSIASFVRSPLTKSSSAIWLREADAKGQSNRAKAACREKEQT